MTKNNKQFDVIIIGAGVIGCSVARYLTRYQTSVMVLEKNNDVGEATSSANSAIVHSGYDPKPGTLKAKFNVKGNKMMEALCEELDVPFSKIGSLTLAFSDEDVETLNELLLRAKENNVKAKILSHDELLKIEPNANPETKCALLCEDAGIVSPFNLAVNLMENAMDNGAELSLNSEVTKIEKIGNIYKVFTKNNDVFEAKIVVNAAGLYSDKICSLVEEPSFHIIPRKGEYFVLDHFNPNFIKHTLFMCPTKVGKGVLVSPTTSLNYIIGPSNDDSEIEDVSTDKKTLDLIRETAKKLVPNIDYTENIRQFSGVRANSSTGDFIIEESKNNSGFFNVAGIMSPGLASSPAIGEYVSDLIKDKLNFKDNESFKPTIKKHLRYTKMSRDEYNELIKKNPSYGKMVCRCEKVTEGEIVDCIHRNCGATTIKGVKRRIRPGFGRCQGTFCEESVLTILARELNKDKKDILYNELGTNVLLDSLKGKKNEK